MSIITKGKFKCPHCEHEFEDNMYKAVEVSDDKLYRQMLINGKFFKYTCPECGKTFMAVYPLSYTDYNNKFMIQYTPMQVKDEIVKLVQENRKEIPSDFTLRVVSATYDLAEKMLILENRLDDRAIECSKLVIHKAFLKQFPKHSVDHIYFNYDKDGDFTYDVIFKDDENKEVVSRAKFDVKLYNKIYHDFRKDFKDDDLIVDYNYGLKLMAKGNEELKKENSDK